MKAGNSGGSSMWKKCEVPWATPMVEIVVTSRRRCRPASSVEARTVFIGRTLGRGRPAQLRWFVKFCRNPAMTGRRSFPAFSPERFAPTAERPLRAKSRVLEHLADIQPHRHDWAQLVFSVTGAVRVNTEASTYIVPPSRAVWIPPGVVHAVTAIEQCD